MRVTCLVVACVGLGVGLAWASYSMPDQGPIGWETRITPGFDPPVEYVVGFGVDTAPNGQPRFDPVEVWGPKAVPVLTDMLKDPGWLRSRYRILNLLDRYKTAETAESLAETAKTLLSRVPKDSREANRLSGVLNSLANQDATAADALVLGASKDEASPYLDQVIRYLEGRAGSSDGGACRDRLKEIAASTDDEGLRKRIENSLIASASTLRAQEPMSVILEREAGEVKQ